MSQSVAHGSRRCEISVSGRVDMMTRWLVLSVFLAGFALAIEPGPRFPPTSGAIWPRPQHQIFSPNYYLFDPNVFKIELVGQKCSILTKAVERYSYILKIMSNLPLKYKRYKQDYNDSPHSYIKLLNVNLTAPCEALPHFDMNEEYQLWVSQESNLLASSVWGALRGLESFSQLFYFSANYNEVRINVTSIEDYPRYKHRGLLIDTSRHYISFENILKTLDAMAMNKMNVLHWHIVDDQSFPYVSDKFPDLSRKGAYHPSMVYNKLMIAAVVNYARNRGIRVMPEIDVPGHTRSWGEAYPHLLTKCYNGDENFIGLGPLHPLRNTTYKLLRDLFAEVQQRFPDKYFHVGGDEVELGCWQSNPELKKFMIMHGLKVQDLHALFMQRAIPLLRRGTNPVVWQEVYQEGVPLAKDTLVQVWKSKYIEPMIQILLHGHKVLFSAEWYLDHLELGFSNLYAYDPREHVLALTDNETVAEMVVGGEACMWGEMADDNNMLTRVWPRASAVAEVLWSASRGPTQLGKAPDGDTLRRIEEHTCRMTRRRIPAAPPAGPGFCLY